MFEREFRRVFRVLQRLSGDPDLASDLAQEAFVKLLQRGDMPVTPVPWLVTVALNQLRNTRSRDARRVQLMTAISDVEATSDAAGPDDVVLADERRRQVRRTLDQLPVRQAKLLMLSAEGYSYGEIAAALDLNDASVGTLLLRAKQAFRATHAENTDAR